MVLSNEMTAHVVAAFFPSIYREKVAVDRMKAKRKKKVMMGLSTNHHPPPPLPDGMRMVKIFQKEFFSLLFFFTFCHPSLDDKSSGDPIMRKRAKSNRAGRRDPDEKRQYQYYMMQQQQQGTGGKRKGKNAWEIWPDKIGRFFSLLAPPAVRSTRSKKLVTIRPAISWWPCSTTTSCCRIVGGDH